MVDFYIFGASTTAGMYLINKLKKDQSDSNLYCYSRTNKDFINLDLESEQNFSDSIQNRKYILISFAPIWSFSIFINNLIESNQKVLTNLLGVIVCSSSSKLTKRFAYNSFDSTLSSKIDKSETYLSDLADKYDFYLSIIRPTLIYSNVGSYEDKNISILIKIMRRTPFIFLPKRTGYRQPIHAFQLALIFYFISNKLMNNDPLRKYISKYNVGGDMQISYTSMLKKIQKSLKNSDKARSCLIIYLPNRIFYYLLSPLILFNPKLYEALLRISANLSDFTPACKILNTKPIDFPFYKKIT